MSGSKTQTAWEFAEAWYGEDAIHRALNRAGSGDFGAWDKLPSDVLSEEFAKWLTHQYRLAMAKGIEIGSRGLHVTLDDETRWILGRPNFWCASVAQVLREDGHKIATKAEEEQAAVIHWLLNLYLSHGEKWRDVAMSETKRIKEKVEGRQDARAD